MSAPAGTGPHTVPSIEELVAIASLREVRVYEFGATAITPPSDDPDDPEFGLAYSARTEPAELEDRFRFDVKTADARYLYDVSAIYALKEPVSVPTHIRVDFAERIGFMVVFPYLREALVANAARLSRRGPLLDFMRPGDLKIEWGPEDGTDAAAEA